ncbi:hypothetical protein STRNTR1_3548 [Stenotrophomonas maltophilia]|nr:hypothetical protein STRNTR1_3548 [Stenotrophomonas maltophilia]
MPPRAPHLHAHCSVSTVHPCIHSGCGVDRATRGQRRSDLRAYVMRDVVVLLSSACKKSLDEICRISRIRSLAAAHRFSGNDTRTATPPPPNEMIERRC